MAREERKPKGEFSEPVSGGSPETQEPSGGGRRFIRWGLLADMAGFAGAFLMVAGAVWLRVRPAEQTAAYALAGAGGALFLFYAGYYISRWLKDPRWAEITNIALYSVVVLLILVGLNFVASRNKKEWDFTAEKIHTLSPETLNTIKQVQDDVKIVVFAQEADPAKERLTTLTRRITAANPRIKVEIADPVRDPLKAIAYGVSGSGTAVYVERGDRRIAAATADEQGITNAFIRILKPPQTVCFTTGHKEKDPKDASEGGYSVIARFFSDKNYQVQTVSLLQKQTVPEECGALVIAGPQTPFLAPEEKALQEYLAKEEARLLIAIDPLTNPGLDNILQRWNLSVDPNLFIIDPKFNRESATYIILGGAGVGFSQESEITKTFTDEGIIFPLVTPILVGKPTPDAKITTILKSMSSSWAQSDKKAFSYQEARGDLKGPLAVGVSIEEGSRRFIVLGDSDFASNLIVENFVANRDLALNMVRWLVKQEELITLTKKEAKSETMTLSRDAAQFIVLYSLLLLPGVFAAFGVMVWWRRRGK